MELNIDPELKAKWVAALRSGEFKQTESVLFNGSNGYCCLGVLGIVCGIPKEYLKDKALINSLDATKYNYPQGLTQFGRQWKQLAFKNDGRMSEVHNPRGEKLNFEKIAALIEQSTEPVIEKSK